MVDIPAALGALGFALFGAGFAAYMAITAWGKARRGEPGDRYPVPRAIPAELEARLARIEQIVEATAIEVERVSEAQRWVARQMSEQTAERRPLPRSAGKVDTPH